MDYIRDLYKRIKTKLFCNKEKHDWEYYTWGSAPVDNLDDTFSFWRIASRECQSCNKHQMKLKSGWEDAKDNLSVEDLL